MNYKFYLFIAIIILMLGYWMGSHNKKETLDGLVKTIMVCNIK